MILAEKIVKLRKEQGWSQEELAVRLNVSRQSVSKWESMASMPDLDKILNMSELFGVNTDYLLKDEAPERALHRLLLVPCAGHLPGRKFYNPLLGLHLDHLACGGGAVCCGAGPQADAAHPALTEGPSSGRQRRTQTVRKGKIP